MGVLLDILQTLASAQTIGAQAVPQRRRRRSRGRSDRWRRPGPARYHWHLSPDRKRHYFVQRAGRWVCPFCGCA
jgi:hypothetical protein